MSGLCKAKDEILKKYTLNEIKRYRMHFIKNIYYLSLVNNILNSSNKKITKE